MVVLSRCTILWNFSSSSWSNKDNFLSIHYSTMLFTYPSVAQSLCFIMQGLPNTTECEGTSTFTKLLGAIITSSSIVIFPTTAELIPIQTLSPITGYPFREPLLACPITTPLCMLQLRPNLALPLIVILYA